MNLHDDWSAGHRIVMHVRIENRKTAGRERAHLGFVEFIAHTDLEGPRNDRHVFTLRMPVRAMRYPSGIFKRTV